MSYWLEKFRHFLLCYMGKWVGRHILAYQRGRHYSVYVYICSLRNIPNFGFSSLQNLETYYHIILGGH